LDGAEFRVSGWPAGYTHIVTPNPAATLTIGNPLVDGCNIGFPSCQTEETVVLYSVQTFNQGGGAATLSLEAHTFPSNFPCPQVVDSSCSSPGSSVVCVPTITAFVNQGDATPPSTPFPADGATGMTLDVSLSWSGGHPGSACAVGIPSHRVYFGTGPDPPFVGEVSPLDDTVFDPGALAPNTTYSWRIECIDTGFGISGPVWSFTTTTFVAVEDIEWSRVKELYR
jgi:hypothetical protein